MILLGSIQRIELVRVLVEQISSEKRRKEATRRHLEALRYGGVGTADEATHIAAKYKLDHSCGTLINLTFVLISE